MMLSPGLLLDLTVWIYADSVNIDVEFLELKAAIATAKRYPVGPSHMSLDLT